MDTPKNSALQKAYDAVHGDRQRDYGPPAANHERTAALWSAFLGIRVSPRDVCWLNVLQKLSRDRHRPTEDNEVDIAGYAENAFLMREQRANRSATFSEPSDTAEVPEADLDGPVPAEAHAMGCPAKVGGRCRCLVEHAYGCSATFGGGNPCDCKPAHPSGIEDEYTPTTETSDDEGTERERKPSFIRFADGGYVSLANPNGGAVLDRHKAVPCAGCGDPLSFAEWTAYRAQLCCECHPYDRPEHAWEAKRAILQAVRGESESE